MTSHAPCLTSTGTLLGCCYLRTLIQQNHVSQSPSLGILSLVFTSVVREGYKWCWIHGGWSFWHPALGCWMRKVDCCPQLVPGLVCHFFITFCNSHPPSWAQAPPGQLQVFLSHFSVLFAQRLKILWQSHLSWSTTELGKSFIFVDQDPWSWNQPHTNKIIIALCCLQIAPPPYTCTDEISNQNIRPPNPFSKEKLLFGEAPAHTAYWIQVIGSDFFSSGASKFSAALETSLTRGSQLQGDA